MTTLIPSKIYWVRFKDEPEATPTVGKWFGTFFHIIGSEEDFLEEDLDVITEIT